MPLALLAHARASAFSSVLRLPMPPASYRKVPRPVFDVSTESFVDFAYDVLLLVTLPPSLFPHRTGTPFTSGGHTDGRQSQGPKGTAASVRAAAATAKGGQRRPGRPPKNTPMVSMLVCTAG